MNDYVTACGLTRTEKTEDVPFADKVYSLGKALEMALNCMERYSKALGGVSLPPKEKREIGEGLAGVIEESKHRVDELTYLIESCRHLIG